jgi:ABC-2 type transport system ATP-binding protein
MEQEKKTIKMLTELLDVEKHLDTQVRKLSLGERMKLELIRSMIHMPQILFLEEPTIGLDVIAKQTIREFLRKVQREFNVTILLTSHDMDDIEHVCDRVVVINHGEKIYDDTLEKLNSKYNEFKFVKCNFDSKELSSLKYSNASNKNINFLNHEIIEKGENYFLFKVKKKVIKSHF